MKAYILNDEDFEKLTLTLDRDPAYGPHGGSNHDITNEERKAILEAHRFYNYQVRTWIAEMKK